MLSLGNDGSGRASSPLLTLDFGSHLGSDSVGEAGWRSAGRGQGGLLRAVDVQDLPALRIALGGGDETTQPSSESGGHGPVCGAPLRWHRAI